MHSISFCGGEAGWKPQKTARRSRKFTAVNTQIAKHVLAWPHTHFKTNTSECAVCIALVSLFWLIFHSGLAEERTKTCLNTQKEIVLTKDHSYCHPPNPPQLWPLNPSALLTPGTQPSLPDAGARPHNPQETCISIKRRLELKDELAGTGLILSSGPGAPCKSPISASPTHSDLQFEPWLSNGPSTTLSSRLQASSDENLPLTVGVPFSVHLEPYQDN